MSNFALDHASKLETNSGILRDTSELAALIQKLHSAENRTHEIISRIEIQLLDISEPEQDDDAKQQQIELSGSIMILNSLREQARYGYPMLWQQWSKVQGERGDQHKLWAGQIEYLNHTHERNQEGIAAVWKQVRDLNDKKAKMGGLSWADVLRLFSGFD